MIAQILSLMGRHVTFWDHGRLASRMLHNFKNRDRLLRGYEQVSDAFIDMENVDENLYAHVLFYQQLDKEYPGSKFILNTCDVDEWIERRKRAGNYLQRAMRSSGIGSEQAMVERWRWMWHQHMQDVMNYFKDREDDLCIFHVDRDSPQLVLEFIEPSYRTLFEHALHAPTTERCGIVWDRGCPFSLQDIMRITSQKPFGISVVVLTHASNRTNMNTLQEFWDQFPLLFFEEEGLIPSFVREYGITSIYAPLPIVSRITSVIRAVDELADVKILADVGHAVPAT